MSSLRQKLASERHERHRLEESSSKRDDEIDRLRSSFDRSLNNITSDTTNLKSILDKSLNKLDKQIRVTEGLASDSEVTSELEDEEYKGKSRNGFTSLPDRIRHNGFSPSSGKSYDDLSTLPSKLKPQKDGAPLKRYDVNGSLTNDYDHELSKVKSGGKKRTKRHALNPLSSPVVAKEVSQEGIIYPKARTKLT